MRLILWCHILVTLLWSMVNSQSTCYRTERRCGNIVRFFLKPFGFCSDRVVAYPCADNIPITNPEATTPDFLQTIDCTKGIYHAARDPSKYYVCDSLDPARRPALMECPVNQVWNQDINSCVPSVNSLSSCPLDGYREYGNYCGLYEECRNNHVTLWRCPDNHRFDLAKTICVWDATC